MPASAAARITSRACSALRGKGDRGRLDLVKRGVGRVSLAGPIIERDLAICRDKYSLLGRCHRTTTFVAASRLQQSRVDPVPNYGVRLSGCRRRRRCGRISRCGRSSLLAGAAAAAAAGEAPSFGTGFNFALASAAALFAAAFARERSSRFLRRRCFHQFPPHGRVRRAAMGVRVLRGRAPKQRRYSPARSLWS